MGGNIQKFGIIALYSAIERQIEIRGQRHNIWSLSTFH